MINITHNVTTETWLKPFYIFGGAVSASLIALTVVGNILTLIVVLQDRSLCRKTFLFIPSLAVADILVGIGFAIRLTQIQGVWCADPLTWKLSFMVLVCGLFLSHAHILAMAIQRFLFVVFPLKCGVWITRKRMYVAIAAMWITGAVYVMPFLSFDLVGDSVSKKCVSSVDGDSPIYFDSTSAMLFLSVLLTLMVTYVRVLRVTKEHATCVNSIPLASSSFNSHGQQIPHIIQQDVKKGSRKGMKFIIVAIGAYLLTWTMNFCTRTAVLVQPELTTWEPWVAIKFTSIIFGISNSSINIFIYACYLSEFRKGYKKILCYCVGRQD